MSFDAEIREMHKEMFPVLGDLLDALGNDPLDKEAVKVALDDLVLRGGEALVGVPESTLEDYVVGQARGVWGCAGLADEVMKGYRAAKATAELDAAGDVLDDLVILSAKGTDMWLRTDSEGYVLVNKAGLVSAVKTHCPTVPLNALTGNGRGSAYTALLEKCSTNVQDVEYDMLVTATSLETVGPVRRKLVLPCAEKKEVDPEWSDEVDMWLRHLAGAEYDKLCDWIAVSHQFGEPTAALYLQGPRQCGKSLFISVMAAPFGGKSVPYDSIAGSAFNAEMLKTPVVSLDEGSTLTKSSSAFFRNLIVQRTHSINEKYRSPATLRGCFRFIVAANDEDALRINENLKREAEEAIGERIFHIESDATAAAYLGKLGRPVTSTWANPDGAAVRHFEWLRVNRGVVPGNRLLVEGDSSKWVRGAARRSTFVQDVLYAVGKALLNNPKDPNDGTRYAPEVAIYSPATQDVHVRPDGLYQAWQDIMGERPAFDRGKLRNTIVSIRTTNGRAQRRRPTDGKQAWGHLLSADQIQAVLDDFDLGTL